MSVAAPPKVGSVPSFTPPSGAGAAFKPAPGAFTPSAPAAPSPADIKKALVERSAQAVVDSLKKVFGDEMAEVANALNSGIFVPGAVSYTHTKKEETPEGMPQSVSIALRPEKIKKEHIVEVTGLSG